MLFMICEMLHPFLHFFFEVNDCKLQIAYYIATYCKDADPIFVTPVKHFLWLNTSFSSKQMFNDNELFRNHCLAY